jgi:hypothetical protein
MAVALVLALAGCNGSSEQARLRHEATQSGTTSKVSDPDDPTADMVNAVGPADAKPPVSLKFRLVTAPRVGQPLDLQVALLQDAKLEIDSLKVWLQPREGLQLKSPSPVVFGQPHVGETHMVPVTVVPQQTGVLSLGVTVLVDTERESLTRIYTVPVLVLPAQPPAADPLASPKGITSTAPAAHPHPR